MSNINPIIHFEMPAKDKERMKRFYSAAFGWTYNQMGKDMGNYTVVMTSESDKNGPVKKGMINGGFYDRTDDPTQHTSLVVAVSDINAGIKRVKDAGGELSGDIMDIPGVGKFIAFFDTEGNRMSMLQPI